MSFWSHFFNRTKPSFVLALGAGGGRGLAHVGVLLALEEQGLRPSMLVGASVGSLVATMYAQQTDANKIQQRILTFLNSKAFQCFNLPSFNHDLYVDQHGGWLERLSAVARQSVLYGRAMTSNAIAKPHVLPYLIDQLDIKGSFADLNIPTHMVATVFPQGHAAVFSSGTLKHALAASMAIPTVFPPVNIAGQRYLDGGVYAEVPIIQAKTLATKHQVVVAINTGARRLGMHDPVNVLGILDWVIDAQAQQLRKRDCVYADILVEPEVQHRLWYDFNEPEKTIDAGYHAMKQQIPHLLKKLQVFA